MKPVVQKRPMGCSVACVASIADITYDQAYRRFDLDNGDDIVQGFTMEEIRRVLLKLGFRYKVSDVVCWNENTTPLGSIIYGVNYRYLNGHYLLKTKQGWMNSWINYPYIVPAKAGFNKGLPIVPKWIMYPEGLK